MNRGVSRRNTLGIKCVFRFRSGYRTRITLEGRRIHIGDYSTPLAAYFAYCHTAKQYFGERAWLQPEHEVRALSAAEMARREAEQQPELVVVDDAPPTVPAQSIPHNATRPAVPFDQV